MEPDEGEVSRNEVLSALRSAKCPKPNLSRQELQALTDLKRNSDIMILPANKGRATVILDKVEYEEKVRQMLSDEKTYEKLKRDPTPIYKKKLVAIVKMLRRPFIFWVYSCKIWLLTLIDSPICT